MINSALLLMCKAPVPGKVKTRLCPPLTHREAADLYACFLNDAAGMAASLQGVRKFLFYSPPGAKKYFRAAPFGQYILMEQKGRDLGERMAHAAGEAFADGARRVVVIGADCPALSAARIRSAFRELADGAGAVFGPAEDGGFYLVGLNAPPPSLFGGVVWSSPTVLEEVLSRCRREGIAYALLPAESDVDTGKDLEGLRKWARAHRRPLCPRTRSWLRLKARPRRT